MSLKLFFSTDDIVKRLHVEEDVETLFTRIAINGSSVERDLIASIDKGKYNSPTSFIDRFGYKLPIEFLSTGCKAALCVVNNPDKPISLKECGHNAIDCILEKCTEGIVVDSPHYSAVYRGDKQIHVEMDNKEFNSIEALNNYIEDERL